jgi:hypothetical protein
MPGFLIIVAPFVIGSCAWQCNAYAKADAALWAFKPLEARLFFCRRGVGATWTQG